MTRPKHPVKELEAVLSAAEEKGWRVERRRKYFNLKCPCDALHKKTVHMSPSGRNYLRNLINVLERDTCWEANS